MIRAKPNKVDFYHPIYTYTVLFTGLLMQSYIGNAIAGLSWGDEMGGGGEGGIMDSLS